MITTIPFAGFYESLYSGELDHVQERFVEYEVEKNPGLNPDIPNEALWHCADYGKAYEKAAQEMGLPPPFRNIRDSLAMVSSWASRFKKYKIDQPKVGAAAALKNLSHLVLIARVNPDGSVMTIEGNHGDAIANVRRQPGGLIFFDIDAYARDQGERVAGYILGTDVLVAGV
jgi:hypothetical protein